VLYPLFAFASPLCVETDSKNRKRESILAAAIDVFVAEGYEQASMDRIAEQAGASKRTLYNHFASKEELFQAVLQKIGRDCEPAARIQYDPKRSLEAQLEDFAQIKLANLANPSWVGMIKVVFGVFARNPDLARRAVRSVHDPDGTFVPWLKAAKADRRLRFKDAEMASAMFGAMIGGGIWWPTVMFDAVTPSQAEILKKEIICTFLARYGA
jgi:TetR/AcrR family transcriptional regulator, regulator of autoinduction and epiphytic fitness